MGLFDEIDRLLGATSVGTRSARGVGSTAALVSHVESRALEEPAPSPAERIARAAILGPFDGALTALGMMSVAVDAMTEMEQRLGSALPTSPIPFPATSALAALGGLVLGVPHAHMHPPNLVPPSPVPIPFPSVGAMFPIPFLSGAHSVSIGGLPAARCGDMGVAMGCGGLFPMFEVFTGSSSVWIEGMRAARTGDLSKHCIFSAPLPCDPPLGLMMGGIIADSSTVKIGGMPMPSLTSLTIAGATRVIFAVGSIARRAATAETFVDHLLSTGAARIEGHAAYAAAVRQDLIAMARTSSGRTVLARIEAAAARSRNAVTIRGLAEVVEEAVPKTNRSVRVVSEHNAFATPSSHGGMFDEAGARGAGTDVVVSHSPERWGPTGASCTTTWLEDGQVVRTRVTRPPAQTTSDAILHHEMTHAANFMDGEGRYKLRAPGESAPRRGVLTYAPGGDAYRNRWKNAEEHVTVLSENGYRRERQGLFGAPQRTSYGVLP